MAIVTGILPELPSEHDQQVFGFHFFWEVCQQCWARNPSSRPTVNGIVRQLKVNKFGNINELLC